MSGSLFLYEDMFIPLGYYPVKQEVRESVRADYPSSMNKKMSLKLIEINYLMPNFPMSTSIGSTTVNPMKTFSFSPLPEPDSPLGYGSGFGSVCASFLPWPTSYPQWLSAVNYEDIFF